MWNKDEEHKMDDDKKAKLTSMVTELGVPEDKIDEHLLWLFKKVSFKLSKLRLVLDEKGIDEAGAKAIIEKMVAKANEKDLAKIKEWRDKHQQEKEAEQN
ncbi:MAG: hypothetical protein ABSB12_02205 [Candidatus Saccharimonadales bacterium]|jgi:hypothetical protein